MLFAVIEFDRDCMMGILINGPDESGQIKACNLSAVTTLRKHPFSHKDIVDSLSKAYFQAERIHVSMVAMIDMQPSSWQSDHPAR